jgi:hypothetical protein
MNEIRRGADDAANEGSLLNANWNKERISETVHNGDKMGLTGSGIGTGKNEKSIVVSGGAGRGALVCSI